MTGDNAEWKVALLRAAKGLRDGEGSLGQSLSHRLCFGEPLTAEERVDLAKLVTDNLLPERNGRPAGETQPYKVQLAAAIEYEDRMRDPNRTLKADELKKAIGTPLRVGGKTVGRWVTEYRREARKIDQYQDRLRADKEGDKPELAGKHVDPKITGEAVLRRIAKLNSKKPT